MALHQLTDEQIKTWTRAQKDEWWLKTVYRGDMPQLTVRSAITGFLLGCILAATAMYILAKTGELVTDVESALDICDVAGACASSRDFLEVLTNELNVEHDGCPIPSG